MWRHGESNKRPAPATGSSGQSSGDAAEDGEIRDHPPRRQVIVVRPIPRCILPEHRYHVLRENEVEPVEIIIDTLDKANHIARVSAPHPGQFMTYVPLSAACPVYIFFKKNYPGINDIVLCFGASYMRRVLLAKEFEFTDWTTEQNTFQAKMPTDEDGVGRIMLYIACIGVAHKTIGDATCYFETRKALGQLVYRFMDSGEFFDLEHDVLTCLDYKLYA
jgi:hypothetical protein